MASLHEKCQDNPYGVNGVVVFGDESYGMTPGCIPDMTGYNQYLRRGNGFSSGFISADGWNDAQASRQMLPVNVGVTVSAISTPMNTRNQLGSRHMDPLFTAGETLDQCLRVSQFWERDEQHEKEEEEEKNLRLKEKKNKAKSRKRRRFRHSGH